VPPAAVSAPPDGPILNFPPNGATVPLVAELSVTVGDDDGDPLAVTFFGRGLQQTIAPTFTLVALPDTQYYSCGAWCGSDPAIFAGQTEWIVEELERLRIRFVSHLGDIVEFGDTFAYEWQNANAAMSLLESPSLPGYPDGIPYGMAVGNHDQVFGTTRFNETFGIDRFADRDYYGGHYGSNNNNHFMLFDNAGLEFIVLSMEYDTSPNPAVLDWARNVLSAFPERRAIILVHYLIDTGEPAPFGPQGQVVFQALRDHPNLLLMLGGHIAGEGRRQDTPHHHPVHTLLADYQNRPNGGDGWLRILRFDPSEDQIAVSTYSPLLDQYEMDADSQFTLTADLQHEVFQPIATLTDVVPGTAVTATWGVLEPGTDYEWYVTVNDGTDTVVGPLWHLSTSHVITKTAADLNGLPLAVNDLVRYEITVVNPFTQTMNGTVVTDVLPVGVTLVAARPAGYTGPNPLVWNAGELAPGLSWTATLTVAVDGTADPIGGNEATVASQTTPAFRTGPVWPPGGGWLGPRLSINDIAVVEGEQGQTSGKLEVVLSVSSTQTVTVSHETQDGTAVAPDDYLSASGALVFPPGVLSQEITVTILGDDLPEIDEYFWVFLNTPTNAVIGDGEAIVTIASDDAYRAFLPVLTRVQSGSGTVPD
jgi:uncharacterized repeat protein (TIGR01451 family)